MILKKQNKVFIIYMSDAEKQRVLNMKPSAYRSMMMGRLGLTKSTPQKERQLKNWKREKWQNLTAKITDNKFLPCGTQGKKQQQKKLPSVCRPSVKINEKTPKPLAGNISKQQIKKAVDIKKQGGRIDWNNL